MVRVAVAGGLGGMGMAIVDAIRAHGEHDYVILSRSNRGRSDVITVDYNDVEGLQRVLEKENIHTVVSAMGVYTEDHHKAQMNLIKAAESSSSVKRFIPSEFGFYVRPEDTGRSISFPFKIQTIEYLEKSRLEFTLIHTGIFLDLFVWPRIPSHLEVQTLWVDLSRGLAVLPGDGNQPIAFTHTKDIGDFVAALLGLPSWRKRYSAFADQLTLNQVVAVAEKALGAPFQKRYDPKEELDRGIATALPKPGETGVFDSHFESEDVFVSYLAMLGSAVADGLGQLDPGTSIKEVFGHLQPLTVQSAFEQWVAAGEEA